MKYLHNVTRQNLKTIQEYLHNFEHMYEFREIIFLNVYWLQLDPINVIKMNS